ncbi:MAG TPA: MATE family efflux transporter [Phycisphaerae bacterium]|nr:MATE family efflux transporter [Phycisphaerae bacterium]
MSHLQDLHVSDPARDPSRWWGLGEVVRLAVPMVLNTISFTIMQFVDGLMVSRTGTAAFSAQLGGGIASFTAICFFVGLLSCVSTFASQHLGAGRPERGALYGWQGLWIAWAAAAVLALAIAPAPYLFGLFGHDAEVTRLETQYFRILMSGALFSLSARALGAWFVGMHRPAVTLVAGVAANVVNVAANYVLIFGHLGFPAMGLAGAGIGTVIGFVTESTILGLVFVVGPLAREYGTRHACRVSRRAILDLFRIGTPAGTMFLGDLLMWTLFMTVIIGHFGTKAMAATNILNRYWHLCFMPALGVSAAVTAIVGRYCGAGRPELAWRRAHAGFILVEGYMVTMGLIIWLGRDGLVGIFNGLSLEFGGPTLVRFVGEVQDPAIQSIASSAVIFILICQAFDAMNVIFIGALRGAGDTLWPGIVQLALAYGVGLTGAATVAWLRPEWGVLGPWSAVSGYVMLLGCVMWGRFLRGRWRTMRVVETGPVPVLDEPPALPLT